MLPITPFLYTARVLPSFHSSDYLSKPGNLFSAADRVLIHYVANTVSDSIDERLGGIGAAPI